MFQRKRVCMWLRVSSSLRRDVFSCGQRWLIFTLVQPVPLLLIGLQIDTTCNVDVHRASSLSLSILSRLVDVFCRVAAERCSSLSAGSVPSCGEPVCAPDGLRTDEGGIDGSRRPENDSEGYASHCLWLSNFFREELMFYLARVGECLDSLCFWVAHVTGEGGNYGRGRDTQAHGCGHTSIHR